MRLRRGGDPRRGTTGRRPHFDRGAHCVGDLSSVRGPREVAGALVAETPLRFEPGSRLRLGDEQLRGATQRRDQIDRPLRLEAEPGPVRGPAGPVLIARRGLGDRDGPTSRKLADVDPHPAGRPRREGDKSAVGGKRGINLQARLRRDPTGVTHAGPRPARARRTISPPTATRPIAAANPVRRPARRGAARRRSSYRRPRRSAGTGRRWRLGGRRRSGERAREQRVTGHQPARLSPRSTATGIPARPRPRGSASSNATTSRSGGASNSCS